MSETATEREVMEYDVIIVGAGPAGLACAIRLKQLKPDLMVAVIEKSAEVGAHILSGAVIEPGPLDELLPGWRDKPPPVCIPVEDDEIVFLTAASRRNCQPRHSNATTVTSSSRWVHCAHGWLHRPRTWVSIFSPAMPLPASIIYRTVPSAVSSSVIWVSIAMENPGILICRVSKYMRR